MTSGCPDPRWIKEMLARLQKEKEAAEQPDRRVEPDHGGTDGGEQRRDQDCGATPT